MSFEVCFLGTGAAIPSSKRNPSAQFITCNNRHILIDCGEGTQMQIRKFGLKLQKIAHILISHLHGDHFFGLVGLISTMHLLGRTSGVTIYCPAELEQIIKNQLELGHAKLDFSIQFVHLQNVKSALIFEDRIIEIHSFQLNHRIPTWGFLIKEKNKERTLLVDVAKKAGLLLEHYPKLKNNQKVEYNNKTYYPEEFTLPPKPSFSYAYISDTAYTEDFLNFIQGTTHIYHEATFIDKDIERARQTYHSTASQAAKFALICGAKQLFMGHFSARYESVNQHLDEARMIFPESYTAEDGLILKIRD